MRLGSICNLLESMLIQFLNKEIADRCRKNPAYSLRAFAKQIGVNSGTLSGILSGKRVLSVKTARKIVEGLSIDQATRKTLLEPLVIDCPEGTSDGVQNQYQALESDAIEAVCNWEYYAVLSVLETKGDHNVRSISRRLGTKPYVVTEALSVLKRLGLVSTRGRRVVTTHKNLTTTHDIPSSVLKNAHRQHIEKALQALDEQDIHARDFSGVTMAINKDKLSLAKTVIREFRRKLCTLLETDNASEVYRLNVQLFSLEKNRKK